MSELSSQHYPDLLSKYPASWIWKSQKQKPVRPNSKYYSQWASQHKNTEMYLK